MEAESHGAQAHHRDQRHRRPAPAASVAKTRCSLRHCPSAPRGPQLLKAARAPREGALQGILGVQRSRLASMRNSEQLCTLVLAKGPKPEVCGGGCPRKTTACMRRADVCPERMARSGQPHPRSALVRGCVAFSTLLVMRGSHALCMAGPLQPSLPVQGSGYAAPQHRRWLAGSGPHDGHDSAYSPGQGVSTATASASCCSSSLGGLHFEETVPQQKGYDVWKVLSIPDTTNHPV